MTDRKTGQSKVIKAVTVTATDDRTFWVGVGLMGIWAIVFLGEAFGLRPDIQGMKGILIDWGPLVAGLSLASPGALGRISSAWKSSK